MKHVKRMIQALPEDITLTKLDFILSVTIGVLIGTILGMLISPRKYMHIGCDNNKHMSFDWEGEEKENQ